MKDKRPVLLLASAATLTLALHQGALAGTEANDPRTAEVPSLAGPAHAPAITESIAPESTAAPAPEVPSAPAADAAPEAPESPASIAEAAQAKMDERYKAMRERAAKSGVELPATPPWKLMTEEERNAHWNKMRNMTPEERAAMRERHWAKMRERATEQGVEMPETPPWKQMQQRREEMRAKWESYRQTIEQMTDQQREAAAAVFGCSRSPRQGTPAQRPYGRNFGPMQPVPNCMLHPPMMPGCGMHRRPAPWAVGDEATIQPPPPPGAGNNLRW